MNYSIESDLPTTKDLSPVRVLTLEDGQKMRIKRTDPFGHWHIHFDKGQVPRLLGGAYTTFSKALADVEDYLAEKGRKISTLNERVTKKG
jgi:hypothetical protein